MTGGVWIRAKPLFIKSWANRWCFRERAGCFAFQYNVTYFSDNPIDNRAYLSIDDASNDLTK